MTDADQKAFAIGVMLRWIFAQLLVAAKDPKTLYNDFATFISTEMQSTQAFADRMLLEGKVETYSNAMSGAHEIKELSKALLDSVTLG